MGNPVIQPNLNIARNDIGIGTKGHLFTMLFGLWLIIGVFVDGWAHTNLDSSLETFFTPWHGILYTGYLACAIWLGWLVMRGRRLGFGWMDTVPPGYKSGILGVLIFGAGGIGDMTWHIIFGIEVGIEALYSPTHLLLFAGGTLIVTSPFRALKYTLPQLPSLSSMITPIISLALGVSFSAFFGMGFWVFGQDSPSQFTSSDLVLTDGISSLLLTIVLLLLPLLWLLTYRRLPFGSITLYFLVPFCLMCVLYPSLSMIAVGLITGLAADALYRGWNLYVDRGLRRRCFFVLIPLLLAGGYYLVLEIWLGVVWNVEFWTGGIVLSGLTGLAISYFQPVEAERVE